MKVPVSWLREYVDFDWPVEQLAAKLVFTSCEVDRIVHRGVVDTDGNLGNFLVGHVVEAGKHPNADRLQLCLVDVGEGEPRQIVCGAWNFGAGATVAVALPGALLPGAEQPLGEAKLRGETSRGMILSERELELGDDHSGIMVLENGIEPGTPLVDVLPLDRVRARDRDGLQPARPDGDLRHRARGLRADGRRPRAAAGPASPSGRPTNRSTCVSRTSRRARATSAGSSAAPTIGPSPAWMRARLLAAGMRSISNVVDITNYVMLALGSPLHAFDRSLLAEGRIVVRRAQPGEKIRTLDGHERELAPARPRDRRREAAGGDRRDHGRRGQRGARRDDRPAARGRELRRPDRAPHLAAAAVAHGRVDALGEGRRPVRRRAGGDLRERAARRPCGRQLDRAHRRPRRPPRAARRCGTARSSSSA